MASRHLVIAVHGIRTFGGWQERLADLLKANDPSIEVTTYKYGYFSALGFAVPFARAVETARFRTALKRLVEREQWDRIDIVAHSFGSYVVAWGLHGLKPDLRPKIHTIILAGSVLRSNFPWDDLLGSCVQRVVNECGTKDSVLILSQLSLSTGMAGRIGFYGMTGNALINRFHDLGHSDYFLVDGSSSDAFMQEAWLPLLLGNEPPKAIDSRGPLTAWIGVRLFLVNHAEPIKLILVTLVLSIPILWYRNLYHQSTERLATSLVVQGQSELGSNNPGAARDLYVDARKVLAKIGYDTLPADLALYEAYRTHPPALMTTTKSPDKIERVVVDADGRFAITLSTQGLRKWDLLTGLEGGELEACKPLALGPWGKRPDHAPPFALAGEIVVGVAPGQREVLACNVTTGKIAWSHPPRDRIVMAIGASKDGRLVAIGEERGDVEVVDVASGRRLERTSTGISDLRGLSFSSDNTKVAGSGWGTFLWIRGNEAKRLTPEGPPITSATVFSKDDKSVIFIDGITLTKWDPNGKTRKETAVEPGGRGYGSDIDRPVVSSDAEYLLVSLRRSVMMNRTVQDQYESLDVLRLKGDGTPDRSPVLKLRHYAVESIDAAFADRSKSLVLASRQGTLSVWDLRQRFWRSEGPLTPHRFCCGDELLVTPTGRGISISDASLLNEVKSIRVNGQYVGVAATSPSGDVIASGGQDGVIRLWNAETGAEVGVLPSHLKNEIKKMEISPDGRKLVAVDASGSAAAWTIADTKLVVTLPPKPGVTSVAYSNDSSRLAIAMSDGTVRIADADAPGHGWEFTAHPAAVVSIAFSSDDQDLVSVGADRSLRTWSSSKWSPNRMKFEVKPVVPEPGKAAAYLRSNNWAVSIAPDRRVAFWNLDEARIAFSFAELIEQMANSITTSADRTRLAIGGAYGSILRFDLDDGVKLLHFEERLKDARARLLINRSDGEALTTLGEWWAFRDRCDLAATLFERAGAQAAPSLRRFRCFATTGRRELAKHELGRLNDAKQVSPMFSALWGKKLDEPLLSDK